MAAPLGSRHGKKLAERAATRPLVRLVRWGGGWTHPFHLRATP